MDWEIHRFKKRKMKFFSLTQLSSPPFQYWVFPMMFKIFFHQLFGLCSMHHIQQPRNDVPNISASVVETPFVTYVMSGLLTSLQSYSHSEREDIQHVHEHGLDSQLPLKFEHSHCCKSELSNHAFFAECHLVEHDNDTLSPKLGELTFYLHYGCLFYYRPHCKSMKFIETKVTAMNCWVLTFN